MVEKLGFPLPPWVVPWAVSVSFVIGSFVEWRLLRRAKEKVEDEQRIKNLEHERCQKEWLEFYRPKIRVECGSNVVGSKVLNPGGFDFDSIFRLVVLNAGMDKLNLAQAFILEIRSEGNLIWAGERMSLTFPVAGQYSTSLQLDSIPAYLEVIGVKDGKLRVASNIHGRGLNIAKANEEIQAPREYLIKVAITASSSQPLEIVLALKWTGQFSDSTLDLVEQKPLLTLPLPLALQCIT